MTPELSTQIWKEKVVGGGGERGTHKGRVYGPGSQNDVRRLHSVLEGIRLLCLLKYHSLHLHWQSRNEEV